MGKLLVRTSGFRRGIALAAGLAMLDRAAAYGEIAGAAPQPTVSQVQARINRLTSQFDKGQRAARPGQPAAVRGPVQAVPGARAPRPR